MRAAQGPRSACRVDRRRWLSGALGLAGAALVGCAQYRMGVRSLYPSDVETVYVPMFESNSFRRFLGERLTEAVMKEIELHTPYKVVSTPDADSVLSGVIYEETKGVSVESPTDEPRELLVQYQVRVSWIDRRGQQLRPTQNVPLPPSLQAVLQTVNLYPEVGQSVATAHQDAIEDLAEQIVAMMEAPW